MVDDEKKSILEADADFIVGSEEIINESEMQKYSSQRILPPPEDKVQPREINYRDPERELARQAGGGPRRREISPDAYMEKEKTPKKITKSPPPKRKKSMTPVIKSIALVIVLIVLLSYLSSAGYLGAFKEALRQDLREGIPTYMEFPISIEYEVSREMWIQSVQGTVEYTIEVARPSTISELQNIIELKATPEYKMSGSFMNWSNTLHTGERDDIQIYYHFISYTYQWNLKSEDTAPPTYPSSLSKYTKQYWKYKPEHPTIKSIAEKATAGKTTTYDKLKALYDYVITTIEYMPSYPGEPKDCLQTLSDRKGDCDDQALLLISLARSMGIASWIVLGVLYDKTRNTWGGHAWVKAYIPLKNGGGVTVVIDPSNKEWLLKDSYRLEEWQDNGNEKDIKRYYTSWKYTYYRRPPEKGDDYRILFVKESKEKIKVVGEEKVGLRDTPKYWRLPAAHPVLPLTILIVLLYIRKIRF